MTLFDFLMVLDSIIIGLGLSEILTGLGQLLRSRGAVRAYGVHAAVVGLILVTLVQHWWDTWGLRDIAQWNFAGLLLFVSGPVLLFLLGYLAFPQSVADWNLEEYYYKHSSLLWGIGALYLVTTLLFRPLVLDARFMSPQNLLRGVAVILCVALASTRRKSFHILGVSVASLFLAFYVFSFTFWQSE
jgi:hypothetical protein